jgi:hypothetical protein
VRAAAPLSASTRRTWQRIGAVLLAALLALVAVHTVANVLGYVRAISYPFGLDYGEGIVWQQAALIPGPRMYGTSTALPFIVFHYPPVYYLVVRLVANITPDLLSAGRLVSSVSTWLIAVLVAGLILATVRVQDGGSRLRPRVIAVTIGLLTLCLHPVQDWGVFMRVDMIAIMLSLAGALVAMRSDGRALGTTVALLLCVASVFAKQTEVPAGIAIFVVTLLRRPRAGLVAAAIALAVALAALGWLQWITHGGFLLNIVEYNINRFSIQAALYDILAERKLAPFVAIMGIAALAILFGLVSGARTGGPVGRLFATVRHADRAGTARAILLLYFALCTLMLVTILKSGGTINYLIEFLCVGSVLIGVLLCDLADTPRAFAATVAVLILGVLPIPFGWSYLRSPQAQTEEREALVQRIAAADKPVSSEDMTLLMRAGKPVIFEPAIATELAIVGRWDETPLVAMIRNHGFAFMITMSNAFNDGTPRSPAMEAAMRAAYPRVEEITPNLWLHLPP